MKKKKIEPITHDEWVREMFPTYEPVPEGGLTIMDIAKITNSLERTTRYRVMEKVKNGELKSHTCLVNGKMVKYYTRIKK